MARRLIDADGLISALFGRAMINTGISEVLLINGIKSFVDNQPTVDAVEVVRCKDCKRFELWTGFCKYGNFYTDADGFCSRAERRGCDG